MSQIENTYLFIFVGAGVIGLGWLIKRVGQKILDRIRIDLD